MSEPLIRRRSLPNSLRRLAQKLDGPLTDAGSSPCGHGVPTGMSSSSEAMVPLGSRVMTAFK